MNAIARLTGAARRAAPAALVLAATALAAAVLPTPASADRTKIILHAISHDDRVHCFVPAEQGYRNPATQTVTSVARASDIDVFLYLVDYEQAEGAGFQLVWPADWAYYGWSADCLGHQITVTDFVDTGIHLGTVFDPVTGGALVPLGYASFTAGAGGEARLAGTWMCAESGRGICYLRRGAEVRIEPPMTGRVAAGGPGYNPAAAMPVAATTWGAIKAGYR